MATTLFRNLLPVVKQMESFANIFNAKNYWFAEKHHERKSGEKTCLASRPVQVFIDETVNFNRRIESRRNTRYVSRSSKEQRTIEYKEVRRPVPCFSKSRNKFRTARERTGNSSKGGYGMNSHTQIPSRLLVPYQISVMCSIWGACSLLHLWSIDKHVKSANNTLLTGRTTIRSPSKPHFLATRIDYWDLPAIWVASIQPVLPRVSITRPSVSIIVPFPSTKLWTSPIVPKLIEYRRRLYATLVYQKFINVVCLTLISLCWYGKRKMTVQMTSAYRINPPIIVDKMPCTLQDSTTSLWKSCEKISPKFD